MAIKPVEEVKRVEEYILINHEYETMTEMARNMGISRYTVAEACERLKITPVSPKEQIVKYALDHKHHLSLGEMAANLDIGDRHMKKILLESDIDALKDPNTWPTRPTEAAPISLTEGNVALRPLSRKEQDGVCLLFVELGLKIEEVRHGVYRFVPDDNWRIRQDGKLVSMGKNNERPPAEYNISIVSDVVREVYAERGIRVKAQK